MHQVEFPTLSAGQSKLIKVTSGVVMGEDILVYGLSRQQLIFVFKFDPTTQKYTYLTRTYENGAESKKGGGTSSSSVFNLNFNQFNLIDGFGLMDSPKE